MGGQGHSGARERSPAVSIELTEAECGASFPIHPAACAVTEPDGTDGGPDVICENDTRRHATDRHGRPFKVATRVRNPVGGARSLLGGCLHLRCCCRRVIVSGHPPGAVEERLDVGAVEWSGEQEALARVARLVS